MNRSHPEHIFWKQLGYNNQIDFSDSRIYIHSFSDIELAHLVSLTQKRSIQITNRDNASVWLVVVDTMNDPRLSTFNEQAIAKRIPLLVLKPIGTEIEYAFFGKDAACWACFEKRHQLLDGPATYLNHTLSMSRPITEPVSYTTTSTTLAFSWITAELEKFFLKVTPSSCCGTLCTLDLETMQTTHHPITKLPHCTTCGTQHNNNNALPNPPQIQIHKKMS